MCSLVRDMGVPVALCGGAVVCGCHFIASFDGVVNLRKLRPHLRGQGTKRGSGRGGWSIHTNDEEVLHSRGDFWASAAPISGGSRKQRGG